MTVRTVFSTLLIFALPLLMLGCDGGGSAMEETQEPAELTFTITNPAAQTNNVTIDRSGVSLQSGDQINLFVRKTDGSETYERTVTYPAPGNSNQVEFGVQPGDYSVDLLAYREVNGTNSAVYAATTGSGEFGTANSDVSLSAGEVKRVDFADGDGGELLEEFDLSFSVPLELASQSQGGSQVDIDLTSISNSSNDLTSLFQTGGAIGVNPSPFDFSGLSSSLESYSTFSKNGGTLESDSKLKLAPGKYENNGGEASVLLQLRLDDALSVSGDPIYLYNNVDGNSQDDVSLEGSGIIIILP